MLDREQEDSTKEGNEVGYMEGRKEGMKETR